ncbi:hypothetical protein QUF88_25645 [Bacillus sp. DX1.1]|uniref:hypothetical protein n=1 Tax=unclassified Bacillus (in: firmicutes) TaxID=185979 RepID=UPI0025704EF0|nr:MULTISPECIES: hypothetical protein [unclassified Bacillus (in: firmicutes)]MDM5157071.1 hypothetical protein [Bacillus sp. DX1.1]WJE81307.1 hypothetical protein QRE67_23185 [Bacillus sp. DX3.1]
MKKGLALGSLGLIIVLVVSYWKADLSIVYWLAGCFSLFLIANAVALLVDGFILGARGTFFSEKPKRKVSRFQAAETFVFAAIPNIVTALGVYVWLL